jgi:hypothetical protein
MAKLSVSETTVLKLRRVCWWLACLRAREGICVASYATLHPRDVNQPLHCLNLTCERPSLALTAAGRVCVLPQEHREPH